MLNCLMMCVVVALVTTPAFAQDDAANAVIKKAITAHGGADLLNKFKAGESKFKGQMALLGTDIEFTGSNMYEIPNTFKMVLDADFAGMKLSLVQLVKGDKVKTMINGVANPLGEKEKAELLQASMQQEVMQLTPLLDEKRYTLKSGGDGMVEGKPASIVLISGKNFKETKAYFDKGTSLLVQTERMGLAPSTDGNPAEVVEISIFSDFKPVSGMKSAHKVSVLHDGKKFMTMTMTETKALEKLDPKAIQIDD